MAKKNGPHKYLLSLYSKVDKFLSSKKIIEEELPDIIVSFCIVVEKVLKVKLHNKNPLLVFDVTSVKNDDSLSIVALRKENDIITARIETILIRFAIVFKNVFTADEFQALRSIYELRNCFVHGYKSDEKIIYDTESVVKKMGTIWVKVSKIALLLFVNKIKNSKPRKKYTEKELEQVLEAEVIKMIKPLRKHRQEVAFFEADLGINYSPGALWSGDRCPRCDSRQFSLGDTKNDWMHTYDFDTIFTGSNDSMPSLYKCKRCNLELTEKQYAIAKKIINRNF